MVERDDEGTKVIAEMVDGIIYSDDPENIRMINKLLLKCGYPDEEPDPTRVIHGSRLWIGEMPSDYQRQFYLDD